jgi:RNA polymerase sigma-70 factor (ECF subfamily)
MADPSERDLVRRCQRGDEAAFRDLVNRYQQMVFALISGSVRDRQRIEDLAQETFLRVYRGLPYFRGDARISSWIFRIVANLCIEERSRTGPPELSLEAIEAHEGRPADVLRLAGSDSGFGALELKDRLDKALSRLSPVDQLLVTGHYLKDVRYEDLAGALNLPLGTVKTRLHRAKRALRLLLQTELG